MHTWKTLKVFASSTFKDLELERDQLAKVFQQLQEDIFARRLHLIPYDLRWQQRYDEDVVRWCLERVNQCQYFVGILGYRYGWRPEFDDVGNINQQKISITEMEIARALKKVARDNRFFCFADLAQYTEQQLAEESQQNQQSQQRLKQMLQDQGERIFTYQTPQQLLQIIQRELKSTLDNEFPPEQKVALETSSYQQALLNIIEEKRRGFVGRTRYLEILHNFTTKESDNNYLVIQRRNPP